MSIAIKAFAFLGVLLLALISVGLALDISDFDRTKGGYTAPYTGVTGETVDWDSMDMTSTGLVKRGYVMNILVDGTSGLISFEIFRHKIDWRTFSDRALIVHKPREAFEKRGFNPEF